MGRLAALLILASQILLLWVTFAPSGESATWFSFAGAPMLAVGVSLGFLALTRRLRREAAQKAADGAPPS